MNVCFESWCIPTHHQQNKNLKGPSSTYFGEPGLQWLIFGIFFWN